MILEVVGHDRSGNIFQRILGGFSSILQYATAIIGAQIFYRITEQIGEMIRATVESVAWFQQLELSLATLAAREMVQLSEGTLTVADVFDQAVIKGKELSDTLADIAILSPYTVESVS